MQSRDEAQRSRAAVKQRPKPAEFREERERETLAGTMAGSAPIYNGSATTRNARGDHSHAHTKRDAHLASLTPLIERLIRRARAQRR